MNTGQVIKRTLSENNKVCKKNTKANTGFRFLTINQSFVPLKLNLSIQAFKNHYFLRTSIIIRCRGNNMPRKSDKRGRLNRCNKRDDLLARLFRDVTLDMGTYDFSIDKNETDLGNFFFLIFSEGYSAF